MDALAVNIKDALFPAASGQNQYLTELTGVGKLVAIITSNAIAFAGFILLIFLVIAGIGVIAAAGNQDPNQAGRGKQAATWAVAGFVVVFAAYWIVQLIGKVTGIDIFGP